MNMFTTSEVMINYSETGKKKTELPFVKMLLLGILAGLLIGLGSVVSNTAAHAIENPSTARTISGLLFAFGLGMVMLTTAELFTGNSLIAVSVCAGKTSLSKMLKNWVIVYISNMIGAVSLALAIVNCGQLNLNSGALAVYTIRIAAAKCGLSFGPAVILGFLCNALVCLGILCSLSAKDTAGRIIGSYLPVVFFVAAGFEHSVANMYAIPAGLLAMANPAYATLAAEAGLNTAALTWGNFFFVNLLPVTIGNILGGAAIGILLWYCHARTSAK